MNKLLFFGCALFLTALPTVSAQTPAGRNLRALDPLTLGLDAGPTAPKAADAGKKAEPEKKPPTEITCEEEANFEEKAHKAVFIGAVHVKDPEFTLDCDKLTAFLKQPPPKEPKKNAAGGVADGEKQAPKATPKAKPSPTPAIKPAANKTANGTKPNGKDETQPSGGGIERALAEGHVVIVQDKLDPDGGEPVHYVGKSSKADYDAVTGDIVLSGTTDPATWPQLQQGINTHIATEAGVVMILNRSGSLRTKGHTKTVISEQSDDKNKTKKPK